MVLICFAKMKILQNPKNPKSLDTFRPQKDDCVLLYNGQIVQ